MTYTSVPCVLDNPSQNQLAPGEAMTDYRLLSYQAGGRVRSGLLIDGRVHDLAALTAAVPALEQLAGALADRRRLTLDGASD